MDIKEFRNGILDDVHFNASINGTSPREEFLAMYANALVEAEEFEDFEQLAYEGVGSQNKKILIDGYYYSELENCLVIITCPFTDSMDVQSLTATEAEMHFKRAVLLWRNPDPDSFKSMRRKVPQDTDWLLTFRSDTAMYPSSNFIF